MTSPARSQAPKVDDIYLGRRPEPVGSAWERSHPRSARLEAVGRAQLLWPSVNAALDIKPLFREKDRNSMIGRFDLWSHQDVRDHASTILAVLRAGTMPCDGKWRSEDIDLFAHWIADGMAE